MDAAALEVTISRLIGKSSEVLSEKAVLPPKLLDQISQALHILKLMLDTFPVPGNGLLRVDDSSNLRWEPRVMSCALEVEDAVDMFLLKASSCPESWKGRLASTIPSFGLWIRVRASRVKAWIFVKKVEELSLHFKKMWGIESFQGFRGSSTGSSSRNPQGLPTTLFNDSTIIGREETADRLADQLTDSEWLRVIFIVGCEGMGKTALVRSVYDRRHTEHHFECQAWICNPDDLKLESILVKILMQSHVKGLKDLELMEIDSLSELLHRSFMEMRYLIVLDDLKCADILNEIMYILPDTRNGSRVVVTSRGIDRVTLPQEPWAFHLSVEQLDNTNSGKLLEERSSINDNRLREKILGKCNGSPLKILLFGGLASVFEQKHTGSSFIAWLSELEDNIQLPNLMCPSFKSLPSWVKPCFLYLCLFPKKSEISTRRIFLLWQAEGLIRWDGNPTAEDCFQELGNRNLLVVVRRRDADNSVKTCHLPGHLHDFLLDMATRFGLLPVRQNANPALISQSHQTAGSPWLAQYSSNNTGLPPQNTETALHIRSYISFNTEKSGIRSREVELLLKPLVDNKKTMLLRVLDLEDVYKPKLPKQFGDLLMNLRYLGLRWTIIDSLPESVSKLSRLETLDLKHTNVAKLPSSILHSKYLQYLYLNEVSFDKCKPTESCLTGIQTLWGLSIGLKSPFLRVLGRLKGLKKLGLTCDSTVIPEVTKSISAMTVLESLRLRSRDLFGQPSHLETSEDMKRLSSLTKLHLLGWLPGKCLHCLPEKLRMLTLSLSEMESDPMGALGELQNLVILRLFGNSYNGEAMVCQKASFPSLQVLRVWKLEKLKKLIICQGAIHSLEELEIRDCKKVWKIAGLEHMPKLKQIRLTQVNEDFVKQVKSTLLNSAAIVTPRALSVSSPEDKEEAAKIENEDVCCDGEINELESWQ